MDRPPRHSATGPGQRLLHALVCLALLWGLAPTVGLVPSAKAAPNACPDTTATLTNSVERTDFCVYYGAGTTADQANTVADHIQAYWDLYTNATFGFDTPLHSGKLGVRLTDTTDCNGSTGSGDNYLTVFDGCFGTTESIKKVSGHELFHRVQFAYDTDYAANWWMTEGTARAMEDNAFSDIDNWATSLTAVSSSFNKQVNQYLSNTNADITSYDQRYNSALWWKYMTEQFGSTPGEPQLGVDALRRLWEAAETLDDIAAVNSALSALGAGVNFDGGFRRFAAANWMKNLTPPAGFANPSFYNYIDEDQAGNPATYGPIVPTNGGTISLGTSASFPNTSISRYGARYFRATPSADNCPVVSAVFHTDAVPVAGPAFYHVVTQKNATSFDSYATSTATDFTRSFFNDGLSSVVAIAGSTNDSAQVDVTLQCVSPTIDIRMPNNIALARVGPHNAPGKLLVQVLVTDNNDPAKPVVAGLTVNDFKVKVNNLNASITAGGFIQQQYWLLVQAPNQSVDGIYDLQVDLEKSGTTNVIATDTNVASVVYNATHFDQVLVIDRSGSMLSDNKMAAAKQAAKFYADITRVDDGLGVVPFDHDVNPAPFPLTKVTAAPNVRQNAKNYIDTLAPGGATSIGDGMAAAVAQRTGSPTGNPLCSFVLLSDGMENSSQFWANVQASVVATGCPVTSIALGAASDETLMQTIATMTGGIFFYNDVFTGASVADTSAADAPADTFLDLANSYEYAQAQGEGRQRISQQKGVISLRQIGASAVQTRTVLIDDSITEALFALDWVPGFPLSMTLRSPSGALIEQADRPYDFVDYESGHLGWRIANPDLEPGVWEVIVDRQIFQGPGDNVSAADVDSTNQSTASAYQVIVSADTFLTINLLLPANWGKSYFTGNRVPIYAIVAGERGIVGLDLWAEVTAPNGQTGRVHLYDDGLHDDGEANDGLYGGLYTLVNQAIVVAPSGEAVTEPQPKDEGSYRVRLDILTSDFSREALGSFSVQEGPDDNGSGLPDPFEQENNLTSAEGDPDLDFLDNQSEYQAGTDPRNSDSDGGGENDGSEISKGKDPLNPADDGIVAPEFLRAFPRNGFNLLTYDVRPEYNNAELWRAPAADGPWQNVTTELPLTGVYSDTEVTNGQTYFYRYIAVDGDLDRSVVLDAVPVTPNTDPIPPEANIAINDDVSTTVSLDVMITVVPFEHLDAASLQDIAQWKLSNTLAGLDTAEWRAFNPASPQAPWTLANTPAGQKATVYAKFRDGANNESLVVLDDILVVESNGGPGGPSQKTFIPLIRTAD